MKNIYEKIKDLIYDSVDYIIMISIIVGVVFIIGWRLDILFAKDALDMPPNGDKIVEIERPVEDPEDDEEVDQESEKEEDPEETGENEEVVTAPKPAEPVKINIPAGSLPSKIGSILEENGLISNRADFIQKAVSLKLDTKLKSGTFTIPADSSIEEILDIITK